MNGYLGLELIVGLGLVVLASESTAPRLRLPNPVLELLGGVVFGFVPAFRSVRLPSGPLVRSSATASSH